ncbi:MAG TPA: dTDP-4-dehydrorhamnose 3,5-epimerase [Solirubrobacteraceae bacterium]|nr:dTDP-4-dehydrorhamnose 3,5-epimerase [Solirubrobacteraceae bacterium]
MELRPARLPGVFELVPVVHADERGFFHETFRRESLRGGPLGEVEFVQENHSRSSAGVLRGMHFQIGRGIGKLVRCARGSIYDVVVDLRRGSPTYAEWEGFELDDLSLRQLWVPVGFAHGFLTLSDLADVIYRQTGYYEPSLERALAWNDPEIAIDWPLAQAPIVSAKDAAAPVLAALSAELPFEFDAGA